MNIITKWTPFDYAFNNSTEGKEITVNLGKISGSDIKATWYNPRNGETKEASVFVNNVNKNSLLPAVVTGRIGY